MPYRTGASCEEAQHARQRPGSRVRGEEAGAANLRGRVAELELPVDGGHPAGLRLLDLDEVVRAVDAADVHLAGRLAHLGVGVDKELAERVDRERELARRADRLRGVRHDEVAELVEAGLVVRRLELAVHGAGGQRHLAVLRARQRREALERPLDLRRHNVPRVAVQEGGEVAHERQRELVPRLEALARHDRVDDGAHVVLVGGDEREDGRVHRLALELVLRVAVLGEERDHHAVGRGAVGVEEQLRHQRLDFPGIEA